MEEEWQTEVGDVGTYEITIIVNDSIDQVTKTITLEVKTLNNIPVIEVPNEIEVVEGDLVSINVTATDADQDNIIISFEGWMESSTKQTTLEDASNLVGTQLDMDDMGDGFAGAGDAVGDFFDLMKSFSESFSSLNGCSSDCVGSSLLRHSSEVIGGPDGLWALSISDQLYELNTQVLILTGLMVLFIVIYLAKPYVVYRITQRNKSKKKEDVSKRSLD